MWVIFLLSAVGFAIGALILFSIGWLVIHKIEMHINRQDDDYENEKENKKEEDNKKITEMYLMDDDKPIMQISDIQDSDLQYEYNTKYKSRLEYKTLLDRYGGSFCIDISESIDYQKILKVFGVDESKIPDKYDMEVSKLIPCRWHKKKRINKKMLKKHGHPNYVHKFETVKGWRLHSYTNGEFEFVKDGDKLLKMLKLQDL